ncbi:MAG: hypothetical protein VX777_04310 [Chlamydiota bacterium]|nr:hypothetical protein [Chlamydiota bacterium]
MTKEKLSLKMFEEKPDLSDSILEHDAFKWVVKNGNNIFYALITFIALLFIVYRMSANEQVRAENDYFTATKDFNTFARSGDADSSAQEQALINLEEVLKRRPELNAKYDALIAQELLVKDKPLTAMPFAERTLSRTSQENLSLYQEFANATLLIATEKYSEALELSNKLKAQIESTRKSESSKLPTENTLTATGSVGETLYVYNLIRIPLLEKQLGNRVSELSSWEFLNGYLYQNQESQSPELRETRIIFDNLFSEGSVSLKNFIEHRIQEIKSAPEINN